MASRSSRRGRPDSSSGNASQPLRSSSSARNSRPTPNTPSREQMQRNSQRRPSGSFNPSAYGRDSYGSQAGRRNTQPREAMGFQPPASGAGQYSRNNAQYARRKRGMSRGKKVGVGMLLVLLLAVVGVGSATAWYMSDINSKLAGNKTAEEQQAIKDVTVPTKNFSDPFYMMLIGSDRRAGSEEDGQRSDTNILVRVDPTKSMITLVSIPRDTKIDIDGQGTNKFNAAYNYGGAAATIREAKQLCGVDIAYYAEVNFEELVNLVDAVGGVEVNVPELIDDPDAGDIVIQPGPQVLDGQAALVFARSRSYVDGDFTRTSNQRLLIEGMVKKVLSLPVTEIPNVIQKAAKCVTTDLSVNDILSLAMQFKNLGSLTVYSAMVPSSILPMGNDGISYVGADKAQLQKMMAIVDAGGDPATLGASGTTSTGGATGTGSAGGSATSTYTAT
ncbi:MAG: LCP family protein [Raoultibacter sp.]